MRSELIQEVAITLELGGSNLSEGAVDVIICELEKYSDDDLGKALQRCRRECKGRVSFADIHSRIPGARPGADEAWAIIPRNEHSSVCWTIEMMEAFGQVQTLLYRDEIAARMSFKEIYVRLVAEAEDENRPVKWEFSGGTDRSERVAALKRAVAQNKISKDFAQKIEPAAFGTVPVLPQLDGKRIESTPRLPIASEDSQLPLSQPGEIDNRRGTFDYIPPDIYALYDRKNIRPYLRAVARYLSCSHVADWLADMMGIPGEKSDSQGQDDGGNQNPASHQTKG